VQRHPRNQLSTEQLPKLSFLPFFGFPNALPAGPFPVMLHSSLNAESSRSQWRYHGVPAAADVCSLAGLRGSLCNLGGSKMHIGGFGASYEGDLVGQNPGLFCGCAGQNANLSATFSLVFGRLPRGYALFFGSLAFLPWGKHCRQHVRKRNEQQWSFTKDTRKPDTADFFAPSAQGAGAGPVCGLLIDLPAKFRS
jgi:hypothetical protein